MIPLTSSFTFIFTLLTHLTHFTPVSAQLSAPYECNTYDRLTSYLWQYHNAFRSSHSQPAAKWANALGDTAFYHAQDTAVNGNNCTGTESLYGWSDTRPIDAEWEPCCLDENVTCTYMKPIQIDPNYFGDGAEVIYSQSKPIDLLEEIEQIYNTHVTHNLDFLLSSEEFSGYDYFGVAVYNYENTGVMSIWSSTVDDAPCQKVYKDPVCNLEGDTMDILSIIAMGLINKERVEVNKVKYGRSHQLTAVAKFHSNDLQLYKQDDQPLSFWSANYPSESILPIEYRWAPCDNLTKCQINGFQQDQAFLITGFYEMAYEVVSDLSDKEAIGIKHVSNAVESLMAEETSRSLLLNQGDWDIGDFNNMGVGIEGQYLSFYFSSEEDSATNCSLPVSKDTVSCPFTNVVRDVTSLEAEALNVLNIFRQSEGATEDAKAPLLNNERLRYTSSLHLTDLVKSPPSIKCGIESWSENYDELVSDDIAWHFCPCYNTASATEKERCQSKQALAIMAYGGREREMIYEHIEAINSPTLVGVAVNNMLEKSEYRSFVTQRDEFSEWSLLNAGVAINGRYLSFHLGEFDSFDDSSDSINQIKCKPVEGSTSTTTQAPTFAQVCYESARQISSLETYLMEKLNALRQLEGEGDNKNPLSWSGGLRGASHFHVHDLSDAGININQCSSLSWSLAVHENVTSQGKLWNGCECYSNNGSPSRDELCTWIQPLLINGWSGTGQISETALTFSVPITTFAQVDVIVNAIQQSARYSDPILGKGKYLGASFTSASCSIHDLYLSCFVSEDTDPEFWQTTCSLTASGASEVNHLRMRWRPIIIAVVITVWTSNFG
eukprot:GHVN01107125.1.p1 GENE.GHVN01107125.1~~GHVN01107125.1.p1  ORF type:complete len:834 (+),score=130.27 GHVN01107125.1:421-2922(+)